MAASSGKSLNDFIADAVKAAVTPRAGRSATPSPVLPTFGGSGLLPGVDLDDSAALLELMDGLRYPSGGVTPARAAERRKPPR